MELHKINSIPKLFSFPLCIIDDGHVNYSVQATNSSFNQICSIEQSEIISKRLFDDGLLEIFRGREDILKRCCSNVVKTKTPTSLILYHLWSNNTERNEKEKWLLEISRLQPVDSSVYLLLTFHNISHVDGFDHKSPNIANFHLAEDRQHEDTKALKDKVQLKHDQFMAATNELDNFVYSVSHDLRAPLRRIDGFSQELINEYSGQLDETATHYLQRIRQGAQDMGHLMDDLLKLSRISRQTIQRESFDIAEMSSKVFNDLRDLEPDQIARLNTPDHPLTTNADPGLMKVLLMNLISNALKFSANKEESVIEVGQENREGKSYFYVKDNGVGFNPAHSNKLFRPFTRLHSQRDFKGTGVGLATVRRIVNLHGGEIFAHSNPGQGAIFYFTLN